MYADGLHETRLTKNRSYDTNPAWSPDGKRIAFISDREGNQEVYIMGADGSNIIRFSRIPSYKYGLAWQPKR